jgi:hypothetical protein
VARDRDPIRIDLAGVGTAAASGFRDRPVDPGFLLDDFRVMSAAAHLVRDHKEAMRREV